MTFRTLTSSSANEEGKADPLRKKIEEAFDEYLSRYLIRASEQRDLEPVINALTAIGRAVQNSRPTLASEHPEIFRTCSRRTAQRELDTLVRCADELVKASSSLHAPTIAALADVGVMQKPIIEMAAEIAAAVRRADASDVPEHVKIVGAPTKEPAGTVARIVINAARKLVPSDRFDSAYGARGVAPLLADIFSILSIEGNARHFVEAAGEQPPL